MLGADCTLLPGALCCLSVVFVLSLILPMSVLPMQLLHAVCCSKPVHVPMPVSTTCMAVLPACLLIAPKPKRMVIVCMHVVMGIHEYARWSF